MDRSSCSSLGSFWAVRPCLLRAYTVWNLGNLQLDQSGPSAVSSKASNRESSFHPLPIFRFQSSYRALHYRDDEVPLGQPSSCDGRLRVPGDYQVWSKSKMDSALKLMNSQVNRRASPEQHCSLERGAILPCSDGLLPQDLRPVDALALMLGGTKSSSKATLPLVET